MREGGGTLDQSKTATEDARARVNVAVDGRGVRRVVISVQALTSNDP